MQLSGLERCVTVGVTRRLQARRVAGPAHCRMKAEWGASPANHVPQSKNQKRPRTAWYAKQTEKKPTDDRTAEGTGRCEEVSQSTPHYPRILAMEFLHFLLLIILEST